MAYRRRHGMSRSLTFKEENLEPPSPPPIPPPVSTATASSSPSSYSNSLAASSASHNINSPVLPHLELPRSKSNLQGFNSDEDTRNDSKGFWGVLARKAKAIIDDEDVSKEFERPNRVGSSYMMDASTDSPRKQQQQQQEHQQQADGYRRMDNPTKRKGLHRLTASLNQIGDSFERVFEEGRTIMESRTQDIIQETRKLQIRRKGNSPMAQNQFNDFNSTLQSPRQLQNQTNHETQLKASRDVAMATASKAKLLLRELKTVKADLAFAKERCAQLEEENKLLRESLEKGDNPEDDDLIRLQLETLLAEKGRLAHENSVYARENRFLREVVEYHQLSMQDVVYLDEGAEELTPVLYPISFPFSKMLSDASPPEVKVEVEAEATPSSSTNHPRSPSPGPGPSQQPMPTEEISAHLTQPTGESSK